MKSCTNVRWRVGGGCWRQREGRAMTLKHEGSLELYVVAAGLNGVVSLLASLALSYQ